VGDIGDGDFLGAFGLAFSFIGAGAETQFVHLSNHGQRPAGCFRPAVGQQGQLEDLRADKEHGRRIGTGRRIHGLFRNLLGNRYGIG